MKFEPTTQKTTIAIYVFLILSLVAVLCFAFFNIDIIWSWVKTLINIISPVILGAIIAYLCNSVMIFCDRRVFSFTEKKKPHPRLRRGLSVALTITIVVGIISLFISAFIPQLVYSYTDLRDHLTGYISTAQKWADDFIKNFPLFDGQYENLNDFLNVNQIAGKLTEFLTGSFLQIDKFASFILSYSSSLVSGVSDTILGIMLSIYFLLSKEKILAQMRKFSSAIFKDTTIEKTKRVFNVLDMTFGGYIKGAFIDAVFVGLTTFILMSLFSLPYAPLIAVIVGVTNIIPYFGPFIGAVPSAFIIFIADPMSVIPFIVLILIIQQIDGNLICPRIMHSTTGLDALWVIIAITVGGGLFGFAGMLLAIPAFATMKIFVKEYIENRLVKQGTASDTLSYYRAGEVPEVKTAPSWTDVAFKKIGQFIRFLLRKIKYLFIWTIKKLKGIFKKKPKQ